MCVCVCVCRQNRAQAAAERVAEIHAKEKSRMQVYTTQGVSLVSDSSESFVKKLKFSSLLQSLANSIRRGFFYSQKIASQWFQKKIFCYS